jgi:hypothetical protein
MCFVRLERGFRGRLAGRGGFFVHRVQSSSALASFPAGQRYLPAHRALSARAASSSDLGEDLAR